MEVSDIIDRVDIVEYISQYIDLEPRGREFWGLSCFSDENTPSFSVDPVKKVFCDFSSGFRGNIIEFIKRHDHVSVADAVRILKRYVGLSDDTEAIGSSGRLEATQVARRYRDVLRKPSQSTAQPMRPNIMSTYEFDREKLQAWVDEGIGWDTLRRYGVRYDAFNDRIVFPIRDYDGNIISVSGRTCDPNYKEKNLRKYTYISKIGSLDTLYGFSDNRESIMTKHEIILFEGAKSCMKALEYGFENTAALLTSHLSLNQLRFLIRLANLNSISVLFALDSDVDIIQDANIIKLCDYARVEWIRNRDGLLEPKDSPVDRGKEVFKTLYERRERVAKDTKAPRRAG